ncbi:conserved hypothetical protein [Pediculus humanus corporis]|uniref:SUN domain-containing protein n=1 Tax=Pediculus humanus subsp. corporis TaxID=121224 RepID=E0VN23_PEDHC|nr:uncharacterized protein Phum_PHUM327380 [Pediculus humanus corporis]EEB14789.1 conserved hypothetical protein [Pediculus humanus corporis]
MKEKKSEFDPVVRLETIDLLKNPKNLKSTFYLKGNKILLKKFNIKFNSRLILIIIFFIFITSTFLCHFGAKILSTFDTESYGTVSLKWWNYKLNIPYQFFNNFFHLSKGPNLVLVPWTKSGDCWAFQGSKGRIAIELSEKIKILAVTIDHIRLSENELQSAPKKFSVFGVLDKSIDLNSDKIHLGTFQYDVTGSTMQTFLISSKLKIRFKIIQVQFESNHGNKYYTCIYKIRVHGHS